MGELAFIFGAGFNIDANLETPSVKIGGYPKIADLAQECFGLGSLPLEQSIEDLFQGAITNNNMDPLDKLYDLILESDYHLAPSLSPGGKHEDNVYLQLLKDFQSAHLLTFNYDSLVEILLFRLGYWRPDDGYSVPVKVWLSRLADLNKLPKYSIRPVLHLHGSICVYTSEFLFERRPGTNVQMMKEKSEPDFIFDPDTIGRCFIPFENVPPGLDFRHVPYRVIAPIPSKAKGLQGEFVKRIYKLAIEKIEEADTIITIGYSFNPHDQESYSKLLHAATGSRVIVVVPEADELVDRLRKDYPGIKWYAVQMTFREWVRNGYQGI